MQKLFSFIICILLFTSCASRKVHRDSELVSIQLVDRNGFRETISTKERLSLYQKADFLQSQPYDKVVRLFGRDNEGRTKGAITSYHENGQIWQYLETLNGRAQGLYKEWYPNGHLKVRSHLIEGMGDLSLECMDSWVFDKESLVYDDKGNLQASFQYEKGELCGLAQEYYQNGQLKKVTPYKKNKEEGEEICYNEKSEVIARTNYSQGLREGKREGFNQQLLPQFVENYHEGLLIEADYFNPNGELVSTIREGKGIQTVYENKTLFACFEYEKGIREGKVCFYYPDGSIQNTYILHEGAKHGEESIYYPAIKGHEAKIKMMLSWYEGKLQGRVKSWYPDGSPESERELYDNKKNGPAFAWYQNGSLMLLEEYENDRLIKGTYMKKGEKTPVSTIEHGHGIASLYDGAGYFLKKVPYQRGEPVEE